MQAFSGQLDSSRFPKVPAVSPHEGISRRYRNEEVSKVRTFDVRSGTAACSHNVSCAGSKVRQASAEESAETGAMGTTVARPLLTMFQLMKQKRWICCKNYSETK